jgi:hypothetical protein
MAKAGAIGGTKKTASSSASSPAPAVKKKKSPAKTSKAAVDQFDATKLPAIGSMREARGAEVPKNDAIGGISSTFPIDALSTIETYGRHSAGFRLDGGSLRNMWLGVRRIEDPGDKKGYELFFWLQGAAIQTFKERLEEQGAKKSSFQFFAAETKGGKGKSVLDRSKTTWSPSAQDGLKLEQSGKWIVELNPGQPEALKGAMRIRVFGTDAGAQKALKDVEKKLGLQALFAPPTPNALERFKLVRLLWTVAPEKARALHWKGFDAVTEEQIEKALESAEVAKSGQDMKAIDAAKMTDPAIAKRVGLGALLLEKDPRAFIEWAHSDYYSQHGILPNTTYSWSTDYSINNALSEAGVSESSAAYKAAAKGPPKGEARRVMLYGLLSKKARDTAEALLSKSADDLKIEDVKKALKSAGVEPTSKRVKDLRFEEVYPGYFTVVDPSLPDELHDAGARYLYSTADNVDRVWSILSSGQKASLVRFSEGLLIQGKSSSSDFGTGGAQAVFTRLVTKSAIGKAKKSGSDSGYSYDYSSKFNNWGGSRPFKVILNPDILGRLDWWGYNHDNYGRSTNLKAENHGEKLVKEIEKNYSSSNELMFPMGNDGAYVEFVACESDEQKDELIKRLKKEGLDSWNGRPLSEFVRVSTKFFELPNLAG